MWVSGLLKTTSLLKRQASHSNILLAGAITKSTLFSKNESDDTRNLRLLKRSATGILGISDLFGHLHIWLT
jgi:hypothetical protein